LMARIFFILLLTSYVSLLVPFGAYMKNRPIANKLGYLPEAEVLKIAVGDQRYLVAEYAVVKVLFYFGSLYEKNSNKIVAKPEYFNMFKTMEKAVKLDPYNMDAYYFTQAAFTWELNRALDVNRILAYGMKYRTWDYQLPFYAGFNAAYFLHNYNDAARYMKKAAELSGTPLFTTLAARYFYEAGQTELGILFLENMAKGAQDKKVKQVYEVRKQALQAVNLLNGAVAKFVAEKNRLPEDINELLSAGILEKIPTDPYGGRFYLEPGGKVASTSRFAFAGGKN
jgi:hypothetical protein